MSSGAYIIKFPSCTGTGTAANGLWTSGVNLTIPAAVTSVTVQGNTTVNCTGTAGTSSWICPATDTTILTDQVPGSNVVMMAFNTGSSTSTVLRITGLTLQGGSALPSGNNKPNGFMTFAGSTQNLRVDHVHFNTQTYLVNTQTFAGFGGGATIYYTVMYGVFDHNHFDAYGSENGVRYYSTNDYPWTQPTQFGTGNFIFIESNYFNGGFVNDCDNAGREVVRYNTILSDSNDSVGDSGAIQTHVLGQGQIRNRSCRAMEEYKNWYNNPTPSFPEFGSADIDAGTGMRWGNTLAAGYKWDLVAQEIREVASGHPQTDAPSGMGYCGSASNGNASPWDANSGLHSGGWPCIDQTGRGQGDQLSGNPPTITNATISCTPNAATAPPTCNAWPHEKLEPWYVWMEPTGTQGFILFQNYNGVTRNNNLDIFSNNTGCEPNGCSNLTTGVGWGTFAQRPASCTAGPGGTYGQSPVGSYGVAYWATDQNTLYICTAANTWGATYAPYTYPHPLAGP
jgi:hypothetical protein